MADSFGDSMMTFTSFGFDTIMGQLKQAGSAVTTFTETANKKLSELASSSKTVFASLSSAVLGSVAALNTDVFGVYTGSVKVLGAVVGNILLPVFRELTLWTTQLAKWLSGLSSETKSTIASFVGWTLVITGVSVAVSLLTSTIGALTVAVVRFVASNPITLAIAAISFVVFELIGGFDGLKSIISALGSVVSAVFGPIVSIIGGAFGFIADLLKNIGAEFRAFFGTIFETFPIIGDMFKAVGAIFSWLGDIGLSAFRGIGSAIMTVVNAIGSMINFLEKLVVAVGVVLKKAANWEFTGYIDDVSAAWDKLDKKREEERKKNMLPDVDGSVRNGIGNQFGNAAQSGFLNSFKAPSVTGIAGSWAAVQSAFKVDPAQQIARDHLDVAKEQLEMQKALVKGQQDGQRNKVRQVGFGG